MASFNKVILMGNLTRDPELRTTPSGQHVCKFGIATSRVFTSKEGEKREDTTFIDIEAWGKTAEVIGKYFSKGRPIHIEGRLKFESWEDKNSGVKRNRLSVYAESFQFVGNKNDNPTDGPDFSNSPQPKTSTPIATQRSNSGPEPLKDSEADPFEDDVPF